MGRRESACRVLYYTATLCLALPLFLIGNRALEKKGVIRVHFALIRRALKKKHPLLAWELFWSSWNLPITTEISRPVYKLCGGNRHPFLATMLTFAYSGFFHLVMACEIIGVIQLLQQQPAHIIPGEPGIVMGTWLLFGLPVACTKWWRTIHAKKGQKITRGPQQ